MMGPHLPFNPSIIHEVDSIPEALKETVQCSFDAVFYSPDGGTLRALTAMAMTLTPWNRDDHNGFAAERKAILETVKENTNTQSFSGATSIPAGRGRCTRVASKPARHAPSTLFVQA
jgi:hypothetical protein